MSVFKRWNGTSWEIVGPQISSTRFDDTNHMIAPEYSPTNTYNIGDYVVQNDKLYKCISTINNIEEWNPIHWTQIKIGNEISKLKTDLDEVIIYSQFSPEFEQGTISSSYKEVTNANRIRTTEAIDITNLYSAQCDANHVIWMAEFNASMNGIRLVTSGSSTTITKNNLLPNTKYVRFILVNKNSATPITPTDDFTFIIKTKRLPMIDEAIEKVNTYSAEIDSINLEVDNLNNDVNDLNSKTDTIETEVNNGIYLESTPDFEQGTISDSYKEVTNTDRIRTIEAIDVTTFYSAQCDANHLIRRAEFDASMNGIRLINSGYRLITKNDLLPNTKYVRFILVNKNSATPITPTDDFTFIIKDEKILIYNVEVDNLNNDVNDLNNKIVVMETEVNNIAYLEFSPDFEQGTISNTYKEAANANRIRTIESIDITNFLLAQCDANHVIWRAEFDASMNGIRLITSGSSTTIKTNDFLSNTKYVRFILVNKSSATPITPTDDFTFVIKSKRLPVIDEAIEKMNTSFSNINLITSDDWELGTFDERGFSQVTYRLRTASLYHVKQGDYIQINKPSSVSDSLTYNIAFYTNNTISSFSGWQSTKYVFNADADIRIAYGKSGSYDPVNWEWINYIGIYSPSYSESIERRTIDTNNIAKSLLHRRQNLGLPFTFRKIHTFGVSVACDFFFMGNDMWTFSASAEDNSTSVSYNVYTYNPETETFSSKRNAKHNLGHVNSINYCPQNDCIICGNGSGIYTLANKFFIVPNASELTGDIDINTNCIVYDCSELNLGAKLNVIWGDDNRGQFDECYGITDDNAHIYRIILGRGANELTYGTLISGKQDNEFNGTFAIVDTYSQNTCGYETCVQGSTFWRGSIYAGIGHSVGGIRIWKMTPQRDGSILTEEHTQPIYTQALTRTGDVGGISVYDDNLMFISMGAGTVIAYNCR